MAIDQKKFEHKHESMLRDVRPLFTRIGDGLSQPMTSSIVFLGAAMFIYINDWGITFADLILVFMFIFWVWLFSRDRSLAFKLPMGAGFPDPHNGRNGKKGKAEGILYLGNVDKSNEEVWFTNSDIRTHFLYLGTTGAGKTEGLKSLVTNAMAWGSGFVYVDGKADTDLWSSLSSLVRRFGRDDDLLVLNYMTGNANIQAPSNTMNPFSSGSASYLTNMLVSLMPESGGDNAMWKERAVSLVGAMMPILTWKRDHQEVPMSVRTIREYLTLANVIKLSRDEAVPREVRIGLIGYLDTLPGFIGAAYDDNGQVKPPGPDTPQYNTETASQQHGYLAMQFTRSLQSLGDDYGYIFDTQAADVDMVDVVLNRRILVVLVPALEKSGDEVANLGKIVAASIKGMMGSTLGSTVEGSSETVIENKPTHSATPFMTVFDEVGYYVAEGMAVMAAQARSLGFSLVFAGQDLPAMKKRVREEANSITANCNIKLFGKLEDPTETKDFFEKTVGSAMVTEVSGFQMTGGTEMRTYYDSRQASVQLRPRAQYDRLRGFKEGMAIITYGETVVDCQVFYSNPGFAKAMRVTRFMSLPPPDDTILKHASAITKLRDLMVNKTWTATRADAAVETPTEIAAMSDGFVAARKGMNVDPVDAGIAALVKIHAIDSEIPRSEPIKTTVTSADDGSSGTGNSGGGGIVASPPTIVSPLAQKPAETSSPLAAVRPADIATQAQSPVQPSGAKPSIFGGKPSAASETPTAFVPPQPVSAPASETPVETPPVQQTSAAAKPSIFGGAQPSVPPATETPVQIQPVATPQENTPSETQVSQPKPAIFGAAKPAQAAPEVQPIPQQTQIIVPPETQETNATPASAQPQAAAKPSIFGGSKPATPEISVPTEAPLPTQEQSAPLEQQPVVAPPVAAPVESVPQEQPPVQTEAANPAKPSIFQKKPTEPPPGDDTGQQG